MSIENILDISDVFELLEKGSRKKYDTIVAELKRHNLSPTLKEEVIRKIISTLRLSVHQITKDHCMLIYELLKLNWASLSVDISNDYQALIVDLVSMQTGPFLFEALKNILNNFKPKVNSNMSEEEEAERIQKEEEVFQRNHQLLHTIYIIVPSSIMVLQNLLTSPFLMPHHRFSSKQTQVAMVTNLLKIISYMNPLRALILKVIIRHLVELDTSSPRDEIIKSEKKIDFEENFDVFEGLNLKQEMQLPQAAILDQLMSQVFHYFQEFFTKKERVINETKALSLELMEVFDQILLTPTSTSHVQFILFYVCSFKKMMASLFMDHLWQKISSPNQDVLFRQLSSSFLGSLLSRANYLSIDCIKSQLNRMSEWIHSYLGNSTDSYAPADYFLRHAPFYFVCQSFFYVIVFRHKAILDSPKGHKFCLNLHLQKIVFSRLNPLKFCLPAIAETFCAVIRNNHIAFCDTVLEKNRRQQLSDLSFSSSSSSSSSSIMSFPFPIAQLNPLISYFPFDPYLLVKSKKYVLPCYQEYENSFLTNPSPQEIAISEEMEYLEIEQETPSGVSISTALSPKLNGYFVYSSSPGFQS